MILAPGAGFVLRTSHSQIRGSGLIAAWVRCGCRNGSVTEPGVWSPRIPTQVVSNEEIWPRPQNRAQARWEHRIGELGAENAKRFGLDRRAFMRTSMGLATAFWASNEAYGQRYWDVDKEEMFEPAAYQQKWPRGEYFVFDVQAHFTNGYAMNFRQSEFMRGMGFDLSDNADAYSFNTFFKEMYLDSETDVLVISGVPGREKNPTEERAAIAADKASGKQVDPMLVRGGGVLPSWLMASRRDEINQIAGATRALSQSNCAPNHYWDTLNDRQDRFALKEQMTREVQEYGNASWKLYCHFDPARTGRGFRLDDDASAYFYEVARELGQTTVSVHKGYASQSRRLRAPCEPRRRGASSPPTSGPHIHHLPFGAQARAHRAGVRRSIILRPDDRGFRVARDTHGHPAAQSGHGQRLLRDRQRLLGPWRSPIRSCACT